MNTTQTHSINGVTCGSCVATRRKEAQPCCPSCIKKFDADPAKYVFKLPK